MSTKANTCCLIKPKAIRPSTQPHNSKFCSFESKAVVRNVLGSPTQLAAGKSSDLKNAKKISLESLAGVDPDREDLQ